MRMGGDCCVVIGNIIFAYTILHYNSMRTYTWLDNVCQLLFIQADNHNESQSRVSQYFMTFASSIAFEYYYSTYELGWHLLIYFWKSYNRNTFYLIKYSDDSLDRRGNERWIHPPSDGHSPSTACDDRRTDMEGPLGQIYMYYTRVLFGICGG